VNSWKKFGKKMSKKVKYKLGQAVWETTLRCNFNCLHCGSSAGSPRPDELNTKESIGLIHDLAELDTKEICLMGGEPFLRKDWFTLGKEIVDNNIKLHFISNGFLINEKKISKIKTLQPHSLTISLDGSRAKTHDYIRGKPGSHTRIMKAIKLAHRENIPVTLITTVSKINMKELPELRDFILNNNIAWQIQIAMPEGRFKKNLALTKEEYYAVAVFIADIKKKYSPKELPVIGAHCIGYNSKYLPCLGLYDKWYGCQAGISAVGIKSNGDIIGCLAIQHDSYIEDNIRKRSIIDIWNDPKSFLYNRNFKVEQLGENCKGCKYGETCRGGCIGMSYGLTGKPHNDPYCFYKIEDEIIKKIGL